MITRSTHPCAKRSRTCLGKRHAAKSRKRFLESPRERRNGESLESSRKGKTESHRYEKSIFDEH